MDAIEKIILTTLKETGYITNDTFTNLRAYPYEHLLKMAIHFLKIITPNSNFPDSLPPMMSARYQMCAQFARICKDLGYKGEVGYHTFMYRNQDDIRKVVIFLFENLPKKTAFQETVENEVGNNITLRQKVSEQLKNMFATKNTNEPVGMCKAPFISVFLETGTLLPNQKIDCKPLEWKDFVVKELPFIDEQMSDHRCFLPSLITLNSDGLLHPTKPKCSKLNLNFLGSNYFDIVSMQSHSRRVRIVGDTSSEDTADELLHNIDKSRIKEFSIDNKNQFRPQSQENLIHAEAESEKDAVIIKLEQEISELNLQVNTLSDELSEITKNNETLRITLREKIKQETSLQQSIQLLPESENNIPKLEAANEKCRTKIAKMKTQWKRHRELLLNKRAELKKFIESKNEEKISLLQRITEFRKDLFDVVEQIEQRQIVEQRLEKYCASVEGIKRNEYILGIFEIIKNLKTQEMHINSVLRDLRKVQKDINILTGKVERSFALTEQLVKNSPADEFSLEAHRLLMAFHNNVADMLTNISESGNYARAAKDFEDQANSQDNVEEALKDITIDIQKLIEEQSTLIDKIRELEATEELSKIISDPSSASPKSKETPNRSRLPYTVYSMIPRGKTEPVNVINVFGDTPSTTKSGIKTNVEVNAPNDSKQDTKANAYGIKSGTSGQNTQTNGTSMQNTQASVDDASKQDNQATVQTTASGAANRNEQ